MNYQPTRTRRADHARMACIRCGIIRTVNASRLTALCRDCADVTAELGESTRWVST